MCVWGGGVKNTLSRGRILLGARNTLYGGLKYFSGGQILIGPKFLLANNILIPYVDADKFIRTHLPHLFVNR